MGCCGEDSAFVVLQHLQLSAAAHNAEERCETGQRPGFLTAFLRIISERVEPGAGGPCASTLARANGAEFCADRRPRCAVQFAAHSGIKVQRYGSPRLEGWSDRFLLLPLVKGNGKLGGISAGLLTGTMCRLSDIPLTTGSGGAESYKKQALEDFISERFRDAAPTSCVLRRPKLPTTCMDSLVLLYPAPLPLGAPTRRDYSQ